VEAWLLFKMAAAVFKLENYKYFQSTALQHYGTSSKNSRSYLSQLLPVTGLKN
jgi:hypothetical protein